MGIEAVKFRRLEPEPPVNLAGLKSRERVTGSNRLLRKDEQKFRCDAQALGSVLRR